MKKNKKFSIAILAALAIASIGIFINKLVFHLASKHEKLYLPNSNYFEWRFGKIYYTKSGQGTPILLIHDLDASQSSYEFRSLISKLEKNYTVYTIDLIGFGKSDKPKITYTNFLFVQLVTDFITTVIKQKTNLVCVGKSTTIGLTVCNYSPNMINKLMFINTPSIKTLNCIPHKNHKINKKILESYLIGTSIFNVSYSKTSLSKQLLSQVSQPSIITKNYILSRNEAAHLGGEAAKYVDASIRCYFTNLNVTHSLKSINNSIYFVTGDGYANYEEIFSEYTELNPSIETDVIPHAKGLPWLENPEQLCNLISIFI
ncbi:alpha/beta fold hydrolase [Anaerosporobacter sp.]|uniref:alpha/beta fold hydrolase n=1 Tax=Anaerosporobacter sp. TaxID=1872529 RepID=UPI00286ED7D4|nr:alpha/beta fold hydrolase [Anaerosporobacter sp.]